MQYPFPKSRRIKSPKRFTLVLRKGVCAADGTLVMFAVKQENLPNAGNDVEHSNRMSRIGITIPKKVGNAAERNRWKRWIRESYRTQVEQIPPGLDMVVRPKKGSKPSWRAIKKSIPNLARKVAKRFV